MLWSMPRTLWPPAAQRQGMAGLDPKQPSLTGEGSCDIPTDQLWAKGRRFPLTLLMGCLLGGQTEAGGYRCEDHPLRLPLPTHALAAFPVSPLSTYLRSRGKAGREGPLGTTFILRHKSYQVRLVWKDSRKIFFLEKFFFFFLNNFNSGKNG